MDFIMPSSRVIDDTRASLMDVLPPGGGEIVRSIGVSGYLEHATVAARERAAGRLLVPEEAAERLCDVMSALGVRCRRGRFRMLRQPSPVEGTDHHGSFVRERAAGARPILYLGVSPLLAEGAEEAEIRGHHALLGRLFGYPACCVSAFSAGASAALDRLPATITTVGPFPSAMNPVLPYLQGFSFLFHFPCTPACEASLGLLLGRQRRLAELAPPAAALQAMGAGIALYGREIGVGLIAHYEELEPGVYRPLVVMTRSDRTRELLSGTADPLVRLRDPHSFTIGRRHFDGPDQVAAIFA